MADVAWVENMKRIVLKAMEEGDPCDIIPGTVIKVSPLSVQINQKTTISGDQILVPEHLTDHAELMSIPGIGEVSVTVKGGLQSGQRVLMLQKRGGQQYAVIDRW
ncbi:DUF2577 domain-containing protein [Lacrimispora celerecrescens]|uniref:Uncharacterized protein DUF2577 n=1 Tax=[Clostridium] celerecrescens 18A TaxID=1286362 RepID=A0A2M8ZAS8_9FIRM|nr:DUF2577 domain-containing protein [Lacrimispora celerecrescens]PJJ30547.1 uncharacterized protein DUF2577 [[Clostridium] celerecrescens 18A]